MPSKRHKHTHTWWCTAAASETTSHKLSWIACCCCESLHFSPWVRREWEKLSSSFSKIASFIFTKDSSPSSSSEAQHFTHDMEHFTCQETRSHSYEKKGNQRGLSLGRQTGWKIRVEITKQVSRLRCGDSQVSSGQCRICSLKRVDATRWKMLFWCVRDPLHNTWSRLVHIDSRESANKHTGHGGD